MTRRADEAMDLYVLDCYVGYEPRVRLTEGGKTQRIRMRVFRWVEEATGYIKEGNAMAFAQHMASRFNQPITLSWVHQCIRHYEGGPLFHRRYRGQGSRTPWAPRVFEEVIGEVHPLAEPEEEDHV